jgi:myo-inositol-1(or 4)-monophosphatase
VPDSLLSAVVAAATEAGALATARWQDKFRRWDKTPGNPVSEIDLEVDVLLRERLRAIDPDAGWLSEETADDPSRLDRERIWLVDPIDGTRDYVRMRPGWAISVALIEAGRPQLGVLVAPAREESWAAVRGGGATCNGKPLRASRQIGLEGARMPTDAPVKILPRGIVRVDKPNSIALRMAMVARGEADFVTTATWGYEWDLAAAQLIASEAGAIVTDAFGEPIAYNTPDAKVFGVLAAAPGLYPQALDMISKWVAGEAAGSRSRGSG